MKDTAQIPLWTREETDSPCVNICVMHPKLGICAGCYRTLDEIGMWSAMPADDRASVKAQLPERASLLKKRRGGRSARLREA
ncbi:DUF1289 domain-containing protein [Pararhodobacter oceanensis]|uniref:DUF1289 domain-containing protein n=1 Tax=Pararhodobacter oceanensis TaxID=2172121 RepID=A0A2T8HVR8_9RHOB|nr:DUF1289 domain-containing protein [Pararhodobacter oceanensis]PVH29505.1 DUF1289 domain-containing protein [Pararhodobacter oceanensis]